MLPAEKLELAIYKHVKALEPQPANVSLPFLSQVVGESNHGRIVERLKDLELENRILLSRYKGGSRLSRGEFGNDGGFFHTDSFLIEIAPHGRKHFEELEQRAKQEANASVATMASGKPLIFVSCGQSTPAERQLGQEITKLVERLTDCGAYFAENQNTLEGVTENILKRLHAAAGFIAIMHPRGDVSNSSTGQQWVRGSVWVEQEIAIAAFISQALQRPMRVRAYVHERILREGLRSQLHLNPKSFHKDHEILDDLSSELPSWGNLTPPRHGEFEAEHTRLVERKVMKLSPESKSVVVYLLHHGKTELNALVKQCRIEQFNDAIQQASREGLVKDSVTGNPARPGTLYYWEINPAFEAVLKDLLGKS
jgi:hypothetical protein